MINLNEMKVKELKELAKIKGVKNWWTMKKDDLIDELIDKLENNSNVNSDDPESIEIDSNTTNQPIEKTCPETNCNSELTYPKRNALIEFNGKSQNICSWGRELKISPNTLYARIYHMHWSIERAFTTAPHKRK